MIQRDTMPSVSAKTTKKEVGSVSIHVHMARNLELEEKCNLYVNIQSDDGNSFQSKQICENNCPTFDFKCHFDVKNETNMLKIELINQSVDIPYVVGEVELNIDNLKHQGIFETWIQLDRCKSGEILLSAQYITLVSESYIEVCQSSHTTTLNPSETGA